MKKPISHLQNVHAHGLEFPHRMRRTGVDCMRVDLQYTSKCLVKHNTERAITLIRPWFTEIMQSNVGLDLYGEPNRPPRLHHPVFESIVRQSRLSNVISVNQGLMIDDVLRAGVNLLCIVN